MKYAPLSLFFLFITMSSLSQNREEVENWLNTVESEFPEIDTSEGKSNLTSGSPTYNRIRFNLVSDALFVPVFGKSYEKLSPIKRKFINMKLIGYKQKKTMIAQESKYPWARRLDWYMWGVFADDRVFEQVVEEVLSLRQLRRQYAQKVEKIKAGELSFAALSNESDNLNNNFGKLLPSELKYLAELIEIKVGSAAKNGLLADIEKLKKLPPNYTSLQELRSFTTNNREAFERADMESQNRLKLQIEKKTQDLLDQIIANETAGLPTMNLERLNTFGLEFKDKYNSFDKYSQVLEAIDRIGNLKAKKVEEKVAAIEQKIASSSEIAALTSIERTYLTHIDLSKHSSIAALSRKIADRKYTIREEAVARSKQKGAAQKKAEAAILKNSGFEWSTAGLKNETLLIDFFKGNFIDIPFNRDEMLFGTLITQFMYATARSCPQNKRDTSVEIQEEVCLQTRVTLENGVAIDETCVDSELRGTGLYATSELYNAHLTIESIMGNDFVKNLGKMLKGMGTDEGLQNMTGLTMDAIAIKADMVLILQSNGCDNGAVKRFEQNLIRFANDEAPIRLDGTSQKQEVDYNLRQDINKLVKDLVYQNSKSWASEYVPNSVKNITVISKDGQNRPRQISANYEFDGILGRQKDKVDITFKNGVPKCILFKKWSSNCGTPDRKVVSNFINGKYAMN